MELLLVRIDHLRDRKRYVGVLREWLKELGLGNGRLVTVGGVHLLFIAADAAKRNDELLEFYRSKLIDTNNRDELCVDRFIDVLGRKKVDQCACKGFLEMNILNESMLRKLLVQDWHVEEAWIDTALATARSKAFLEWREAAKAARSDRRKRSAKERTEQREAKKLKLEQEKKEDQQAAQGDADEPGSSVESAEEATKEATEGEDAPPAAVESSVEQHGKGSATKKKKKRKNKHKTNQAAK